MHNLDLNSRLIILFDKPYTNVTQSIVAKQSKSFSSNAIACYEGRNRSNPNTNRHGVEVHLLGALAKSGTIGLV